MFFQIDSRKKSTDLGLGSHIFGPRISFSQFPGPRLSLPQGAGENTPKNPLTELIGTSHPLGLSEKTAHFERAVIELKHQAFRVSNDSPILSITFRQTNTAMETQSFEDVSMMYLLY